MIRVTTTVQAVPVWCAAWTVDRLLNPFYYSQSLMDFFFSSWILNTIYNYIWQVNARSGIKTWALLAFILMLVLPGTLGRSGNALGAGGWARRPAQGAAAPLGARRSVLCRAGRQGWRGHCQKLTPAASVPGRARIWWLYCWNQSCNLLLPLFIFLLSLSASLSVAVGNSWEKKKISHSAMKSIHRQGRARPFLALLQLRVVFSLDGEEQTHWWQVAALMSKGTAALSGVTRFETYVVLTQIPQKATVRKAWAKIFE